MATQAFIVQRGTVTQESVNLHCFVPTLKANVAPRILVGDTPDVKKTQRHLNGFEYERSTVVIHRDPNLMPTLQKDWAVGLKCFLPIMSWEILVFFYRWWLLVAACRLGNEHGEQWRPNASDV